MKKILLCLTLLLVLTGCSATAETEINPSDFSIDSNGNLVYQNEIIGKVAGQNGIDGINGQDGIDGLNGKNGTNGTDGVSGINGSNGSNGKDGYTPYIGSNGNWWINEQDTGYLAGSQAYTIGDSISTLTPNGSILSVYEYTNGWSNRTLTDVEVINFNVNLVSTLDRERILTDDEYYTSLVNNGYPTAEKFIAIYKYQISYDIKIKLNENYKTLLVNIVLSESATSGWLNGYADIQGIYEIQGIAYVNNLDDIGLRVFLGNQS